MTVEKITIKQKPEDRVLPVILDSEQIIKALTKNILIGFPRSGNTALRLFLEKYTNRPSGRPLLINGKIIGTDTGSSILFKGKKLAEILNNYIPVLTRIHRFWEVDLLHEDKIIYLLRDYRDCIPGIMKYDDNVFSEWYQKRDYNNENYGYNTYNEFLEKLLDYSYNYGEQLKQFIFLPNRKKILFYYEEMVANFENIAENMLNFLEIPVDKEKIRRCNVINEAGRSETDKHFRDVGRKESEINTGCMRFIGEYRDVLQEKELRFLRLLFKKQLGEKLYIRLLGRYE